MNWNCNWNAVIGVSSLITAIATILALAFAGLQIHELREEAKIQHIVDQVKEFEGTRFTAI